jgi:nicotinamidase/pyrazinamidase
VIKADLLIIDPQNDFCDPKGALYVPGAEADMDRLATFINRVGDRLNDIHTTLDTHHYYDRSHPVYWRNAKGEHPAPFTIIEYCGEWYPVNPNERDDCENYLAELKSGGRYPHIIWPPHCLVGTWGHNVYPSVAEALLEWEKKNVAMVDYVTKGSNYRREHYSAVQAEVIDVDDPDTQLNMRLIETLEQVDEIYAAGEALSHCLANTLRDIVRVFGDENAKKFTILEDLSSNVPGFEAYGEQFLQEMKALGVRVAKSADCF